jgi:hypothetical protein
VVHSWSPFGDRLAKRITCYQRLLKVHEVSNLSTTWSLTWNITLVVSTKIKQVMPRKRTYVSVGIKSSNSTVEVIVSQSNIR